MNLRKYANKKVIAIVTAIMLIFGGIFIQHNKIKNLEHEIYKYQNMTEQKYNYTETTPDVKSLEEDLNSVCEYKILDGKINIKHTYAYQRDSILGLKSKKKLVGTADFYYELIVNLQNAKIVRLDERKIIMEVDYPVVNEEACHRVRDSFIRMDDECDQSLLANNEDSEKATRQWEDTFDKKGTEFVKEYYTYDDVKKDVRKITVREVETLLRELGYSQNLEIIVR